MNPFVGEVRAVGFNFAPLGWAFCNGQLMPILQNTELFAVIGTNFGGDGKTTFALPNLQAQFPLGAGPGGPSTYLIGDQEGVSQVVLTSANLASHTHSAVASSGQGTTNAPANAVWAQPQYGRAFDQAYATTGATAPMSATVLAGTGANAPHNNLPPYLVVNFIIALAGVFPARQ